MNKNLSLISVSLAGLLLLACDSSTSKPSDFSLTKEIQSQYANLAYNNYSDVLESALKLKSKIEVFKQNPDTQSFNEAKQAWLDSRNSYGQSEAFRFYGGPIDSETGPEGLINAWPLDEAYIDYVEGDLKAGIITNTFDFPKISSTILAEANENPGETDISTGYHAIEFLLWGQDLSAPNMKQAGQRPLSDFTTQTNAIRRLEYLETLANLLVENLTEVKNQWTPDQNNFRKEWLNMKADSAIGLILLSMGSLSGGELAGERMSVALANADQEDEHSCFSDNTHEDIINNAQGILNLWNGSYKSQNFSTSGKGLKDLAQNEDADLAKALDDKINNSVLLAKTIPIPFDWAISFENQSGRTSVEATIKSLQAQTLDLGALAEKLNIKINF